MNSSPNYYTILQVSQQANLEEIKKSFRKLALQFHPDKVEESKREEAKRQFQELHIAYKTLSNPEKKEKYDYELRYGEHRREHRGGFFFRSSRFRSNRRRFDFRAYNVSQVQNIFNDLKKKFAEQSQTESSKPKGGYSW